jgi:hypothetical protein
MGSVRLKTASARWLGVQTLRSYRPALLDRPGPRCRNMRSKLWGPVAAWVASFGSNAPSRGPLGTRSVPHLHVGDSDEMVVIHPS